MANQMQDISALVVDDDPELAEIEALLGGAGDDPKAGGDNTPATGDGTDPDPSDVLAAELQKLRGEIAGIRKEAGEKKDGDKGDAGIKLDIPDLDDGQLGQLAKYKDKLEAIAKHATGDTLKQVTEELNRLRAELQQTKEELARKDQATFATTLRAVIPDLDELHQDPEFAKYLKKKAPYTGGMTLAQLLEDAYEKQDLQRAKEIIDGFRASNESNDIPAVPGASSRPPVRGRSGTAPTSPTGLTEEKKAELMAKVNRLYQEKKISYTKLLEYTKQLEAQTVEKEVV